MTDKEIVLGPGAKSDKDVKKAEKFEAKHPETTTALPVEEESA